MASPTSVVFCVTLASLAAAGAADQTVIIVRSRTSGPDAGDAFASFIGGIFSFLLYICVAGCLCTCCAMRYCVYKAQQMTAGGGPAPTTFVGRMKSVVVRCANTASADTCWTRLH